MQYIKPTFSYLEWEFLSSIPAGVELSAIQKRAHVVHKHFVTSHR